MIIALNLKAQLSWDIKLKPSYYLFFGTWREKIISQTPNTNIYMSKNTNLGNINFTSSKFGLDDVSLWVDICKYQKFNFGLVVGRGESTVAVRHQYNSQVKMQGAYGGYSSEMTNDLFFQFGIYSSYSFSDKLKSKRALSLFVSLMSHKTWYLDYPPFGFTTGDGIFYSDYVPDTTYSRTMGFCMQVRYEKIYKIKGKDRVGFFIAYQQGFRTIGAYNARSYLQSYDHTNDQELITRAITKGSGFYVGINFPIQLKKRQENENN